MKLYKTKLSDPPLVYDAAVVIDVCRAFTTAAYAFAAGVDKILLVKTVEEAFSLKFQFPDAMLMGEENGLPVSGFDLWNSPSELGSRDLTGRMLIQRTTAGTRGMVAYQDIPILLAGTFVNAGSTIKYLQDISTGSVAFLMTGVHSESSGQEDIACADYFIDKLSGRERETSNYIGRIDNWIPEKISTQPDILKFFMQILIAAAGLILLIL